jgi:phage shock protein E
MKVKLIVYSLFSFLGAAAGYIYFYYWGCDGSCAITSSPINSSIYGAVMGFLLSQIFEKDKSKEKAEGNN